MRTLKGYFDYAASCPIDEEALETYVKASREYVGNSTSLHDAGTKASRLIEHCRETLSHLIGGEAKSVYFTSGGSEGNFLAFQALLSAHKGRHIVLSEGEHASVRNAALKFEEQGYNVSHVPLTSEGVVDIGILKALVTNDTALVSIHHVNSEIGTVQPLEEIAAICRGSGAFFHSDCVQSFGKLDLSQVTQYVDGLTLSGHKVYGPKGVGALYLSPLYTYQPFLPNGVHEAGMRAGTLNVPGIAAFTVAAEKCVNTMAIFQEKFAAWKHVIERDLSRVPGKVEIVPSDQRVPIMGLLVHRLEGQWLMLEGNRAGFCFSTGTACQVGSQKPSRTLLSMGKTVDEARTFIRLSFGHDQTLEDVKELSDWLRRVIEERAATVVQ